MIRTGTASGLVPMSMRKRSARVVRDNIKIPHVVRIVAAKAPRKQSKPAAQKTPPPKSRSLFARGLRNLWRPLPLLIAAVGLAGVMFWPQIVASLPDLASRDQFHATWADIDVTPPDPWVPEDLVSQVHRRSGMDQTYSLLSGSLVEELAGAFAEHPWVAEVQSVTKHSGRIRVQLTYRRPALMVQTKRGVYPVDDHGVLLPPADFSAEDAELFPRLEGVRSTPQGPAGSAWGDAAVDGGSRLAWELSRDDETKSAWDRYGLQSIIVFSTQQDNAAVDTDLYGLTTVTGSRIVWGHAPGEDDLEPTIQQKFERLDEFLADNGPFEEMPEPVVIDVHDWELIHWGVISRTPQESDVLR